MTGDEALALARSGDLATLGEARGSLATAVRAFADAGDPASALELFGRCWRIWFSRGELAEGAALAASALAAAGPGGDSAWRTRALYADGLFAFRAGDSDRSLRRNEEALRLARGSGDVRGECDALTGLARIALREGRHRDVVELAERARELARHGGDREAEAAPLHLHAAGLRLLERHGAARDLYMASLELNKTLGNSAGVAMEQHNLGWVELHLGNPAGAEAWFRLCEHPENPDEYGRAWSHLNRAAVAAARGDTDAAYRSYSKGISALHTLGIVLDPDDQFELDWLRARLGRD
jgi:tetratricopeptide (TPR) repeat protein